MLEEVISYPVLRSFMKRHGLTITNMAGIISRSYPCAHKKISKKTTDAGKESKFDIDEARAIVKFVIETEQQYLMGKFGEDWKSEWEKRWGHIKDWFSYTFFDEVVTIATTAKEE